MPSYQQSARHVARPVSPADPAPQSAENANPVDAAALPDALAVGVPGRRSRSTTPELFNAGVRFDATRLELREVRAELAGDRPADARLEQLRAILDQARPVIDAPTSDADPRDVAEAREFVLEIGRLLDQVHGRVAAEGGTL